VRVRHEREGPGHKGKDRFPARLVNESVLLCLGKRIVSLCDNRHLQNVGHSVMIIKFERHLDLLVCRVDDCGSSQLGRLLEVQGCLTHLFILLREKWFMK
jgi:hypothetical protein